MTTETVATTACSSAIDKTKPVPINMRVDFKKRDLIDVAAALSGSDRTSFILDAACKKAEEVILDQRLFVLADNDFDAFEQALQNNPVRSNQWLQKLLNRPTRWS
ncbi:MULTISPECIES: DUF1778 domain-containing protein [Pseudomonas]|uniref:type II toxin-antitoxin system TacA family antitoxin n=1 Tax=Pseudomonas TaxID=286 RepID=UPI0015A0B4B0|nr:MULTISPECIES: DUF1778 domain-containing protein [Pseudomonas]MBA6043728.1 DUF1778 domain-containing protein [Pseudomonas lactis]NWD63540.1 DUF1778 domain-containing protein [Pseudomonas sp. IPO3774]